MAITTLNFTELVRRQAAAVQGAASVLIDVTVGSITRAIIEANASMALWLQGLILRVLARSRASTSTDTDLDSWMADFGFARLGSTLSAGVVTFSRFTAGASPITIPAGTKVQTGDGAWQFVTTSAVTLAAGLTSAQASVTAVLGGAGGNAAIGQVSVITSSLAGIDTVTNAAAFVGGADAELDDAYRARFRVWLAGLSKGTKAAIGAAITAVRPGLTYTITENVTYAGQTQQGHFFVVVDDGTGAPSPSLLAQVQGAVDAARALTTSIAVFGPVVVPASVALVVGIAPGYDPTATRLAVQTALANYINSLPLGASLPYTRLAQVAYDASAGVLNVSGVTLAGGAADLAATSKQVIKAGPITVS